MAASSVLAEDRRIVLVLDAIDRVQIFQILHDIADREGRNARQTRITGDCRFRCETT
jgi:hypothetical protein